MDKNTIEKSSMDKLSRRKKSIDKTTIEKKSIDKLSMDKLSIQNQNVPETFAYLFSHFLPKLDPARQTLLLWLVWLSDEQGQTPPMSYKDLSHRCGMSSKTAARTIKSLIKEGVIRIEKNAYSREATRYAITLPE
jgi:DNA replication protein DnaD